jgi:hypothetical protein
MRCYLMRQGHIASVRELPGLDDATAIEFSRNIFEKHRDQYDGFEVWELSRMVVQHPPPAPIVLRAPPPVELASSRESGLGDGVAKPGAGTGNGFDTGNVHSTNAAASPPSA